MSFTSLLLYNMAYIHTIYIQISSSDMLFSRDLADKYLTIDNITGIDGYIWRVDGEFRTITSDIPIDNNGNVTLLNTTYRIENKNGVSGLGNCVGEFVLIKYEDRQGVVYCA